MHRPDTRLCNMVLGLLGCLLAVLVTFGTGQLQVTVPGVVVPTARAGLHF